MKWIPRRGELRPGRARWRVSAVLLAATALVAAGCGGLSGSGAPAASAGSLSASGINLSGQTYTVGGKNFDEQLLLCKMQIAAIQSVGGQAEDRCNIPGSAAARTAILSGDIDMYWSYTGTGWVTDLQQSPPIQDSQAQYIAVRDMDLQRNNIVWTEPTPFNNTYAIATTQAFAQQNNLRTTTDFANFVNSGNPDATLCVESEFAVRPDGLPGLRQTYGITAPLASPPQVVTLDTGAIYQATANGNPCKFGEVFTTDGRIPGLRLVSLEDDRNYFPKYNASNNIRRDVVDRNPQIVQLSNEIARRLDFDTELRLTGQISSEGQDPDLVARNWLKSQGLIGQ
ncbi:glycine betaine ABC transporter substrate-binding protein [Actinomycetospora sp. CA-101289]|uniref:glycine betaine ABC transporter substrate-binding protein n=1 Tax=Actinomycetospora sp. CA-101289 TaxID=3239893 RepID=UPI003D9660B6